MHAAARTANEPPNTPPPKSEPPEILDVRGISAPDNLLAVLKRVTELGAGARLELRVDSNPFQLYDLLQQRGFFLTNLRKENGWYTGVIAPRDVTALQH